MIRASGNHDILEDFPRSGEIDHYRAFRKKEGNGDTALRGGRERVPFAVLSGTAGSTSRSGRIRTRADFTNSRERNCRDQPDFSCSSKQLFSSEGICSSVHDRQLLLGCNGSNDNYHLNPATGASVIL